MHGLGNDYIYVNAIEYPLGDPARLSVLWSDRHKGIGADGLILIGKSDKADFSMRIFNADGSEAEMCGNGIRCVGRFIHDKGLSDKTVLTIETLAGIKVLHMNGDGSVSVEMGTAFPGGKVLGGTPVSMGNPHLVLFVDDAEAAPVAETGPRLEKDPAFPEGTNVEFAQVLDSTHIRMRVWERGSGITMACGTGACATAVAAAAAGLTSPDGCTILMDGGSLTVAWDPETGKVTMTGPATPVFEGTIEQTFNHNSSK